MNSGFYAAAMPAKASGFQTLESRLPGRAPTGAADELVATVRSAETDHW